MKQFFVFFISLGGSFAWAQPLRLVLPKGHTNWVWFARYSPDGKFIVTASGDKTAKIWSAADGRLLTELQGHISTVKTANYSTDGKFIVTASLDGTAKIWNAEEGARVSNLKGHAGWVMCANFSPNGKYVVTASVDKTIKIWDMANGKTVKEWRAHDAGINSAVYSPDGKYILTASRDSVEKIWDAADGKLIREMKGHHYYVNTAMFSRDGQYIVTASDDGTSIIRNKEGKIVQRLMGYNNSVNSAVFSPDGKYIATASSDSTVKIWSISNGKLTRTLVGHLDRVFYASFSPDGKYIVSASQDQIVRIWNVNDGSFVRELKGHTSIIFSTAYSADGRFIVSSSYDNSAKVWDAGEGKLLNQLKGHTDKVNFVTTSLNSKNILTASWDNTARIWDAANGKLIAELKGHNQRVNSAMYSPDKKKIVTSSDDNSVKIWNAADGTFLNDLPECKDFVKFAVFSPDGKYIVTASIGDNTKIWNATTGELVMQLKSKEIKTLDWKALYDPTGKYIITANGVTETGDTDKAKIWDASNGAIIQELNGHRGWVFSAVYSPDGKQIVTVSEDGTGKIWDPANGKIIAELIGHTSAVFSCMYNPDGKKIVTASEDNTLKIWDSKTGRLIYTFFTVDSTDYILLLPDGYYSCTQSASKLLNYVRGLQAISFEQLDIKYNRPDKVLEAIGNTDTALIKSYRKAYEKRIRKLGIDTTAFRDGHSVPEADFVNRDNIEYDQKNEQLSLNIKGLDSTYKLDRFNVWVNEVPVFGLKGKSIRFKNANSFDTTLTIKLSQGENRIETSITNINGTESYRMPLIVKYTSAKPLKETAYFIGIGIDRFADNKYNLQYSSKDIRDLSLKLKAKYGNDIVIDTLFNENVTVKNVNSLKKKLQQTNENDKVIIAYSGHGLLSKEYDYYLSTYAVNFEKPGQNGLPYDKLESLLDSIPARKKLMLIDACHSGEVDKEEGIAMSRTADSMGLSKGVKIPESSKQQVGLKNSFELMQNLFVNVGKSTGATIISAAAGNQFALERGDLKNGVFTFSILEAMNKYPTMKISELKRTVGERVEQLTNGMQKPTSRNETIAVDWNLW